MLMRSITFQRPSDPRRQQRAVYRTKITGEAYTRRRTIRREEHSSEYSARPGQFGTSF